VGHDRRLVQGAYRHAWAVARSFSRVVGVLATVLPCVISILGSAILADGEAHAQTLEEASSSMLVNCGQEQILDTYVGPVEISCDVDVVTPTKLGRSVALATTSLGSIGMATANAECIECPFQVSTWASSRITYQLVVDPIAPPPAPVSHVPVLISTQGSAGVSLLGMHAGSGTFVRSSPAIAFPNGDVFTERAATNSFPVQQVLAEYDVVESLDLVPGNIYPVDLTAGCNDSLTGSWACNVTTRAAFVLAQARFDLLRGAATFDLANYFVVQQSPVPEPESAALGLAAGGALAACAMRWRRPTRR